MTRATVKYETIDRLINRLKGYREKYGAEIQVRIRYGESLEPVSIVYHKPTSENPDPILFFY